MPHLQNVRHERFAAAIASGKTGTESYQLAGYPVSRKVAAACASRLLRKVSVSARVAELRSEAADKLHLSVERALQSLARVGFANILDYVDIDADGNPIPNLADVTSSEAAAIAEVRVDTYMEGRGVHARPVKRVTLKLHDKIKALAALAELLRDLPESPENTQVAEPQPMAKLKLLDFKKIKKELEKI
jgi:phage terminase small subunit